MALSARGANLGTIAYDHGPLNPYHPVHNPKGPVQFLYAENRLMHSHLARFLAAHPPVDAALCAYGEGYTGAHRLRTAMAAHLNENFRPVVPLGPEELVFAAGVTALNEAVALALCDPGDGILLGKYNYGAFPTDLGARTGVKIVHAEFGGAMGAGQFDDVVSCVAAHERAFLAAKDSGIKVRAVMLCNPNNPLGRCYTHEVLQALVRWCQGRALHLVSDEIYGLSVYPRDDRQAESFTSVLAVQGEDVRSFEKEFVHVLYGFSKDYAAGGLRLGCVVSRNEDFLRAVRGGVCRFSSPSSLSQDVVTKMLEDRVWMRDFLQRSQEALRQQRMLTERLLDEAGIDYYRHGNAGLFMWLDLSPYLALSETNGDGWAAERLLSKKLRDNGVEMSTGERYQSELPGFFRMIFSYDKASLREGIKRISNTVRSASGKEG